MQSINPQDLICMNDQISEKLVIDLVYADASHPENIFDTDLYHKEAKLWVHKDLAAVIDRVATVLHENHGWTLVLKDGLRTVETQAAMQETPIVKAHPEWCEGEERLLSPPGCGAHPRGMAIDVAALSAEGKEIDMGTPFDYMEIESHRSYTDLPDSVLQNRKILEEAFVTAGNETGHPILPLPNEWWDFRFYPDYTKDFTPIHDRDIPQEMRMHSVDTITASSAA